MKERKYYSVLSNVPSKLHFCLENLGYFRLNISQIFYLISRKNQSIFENKFQRYILVKNRIIFVNFATFQWSNVFRLGNSDLSHLTKRLSDRSNFDHFLEVQYVFDEGRVSFARVQSNKNIHKIYKLSLFPPLAMLLMCFNCS